VAKTQQRASSSARAKECTNNFFRNCFSKTPALRRSFAFGIVLRSLDKRGKPMATISSSELRNFLKQRLSQILIEVEKISRLTDAPKRTLHLSVVLGPNKFDELLDAAVDEFALRCRRSGPDGVVELDV
jgi:hypothetical protein